MSEWIEIGINLIFVGIIVGLILTLALVINGYRPQDVIFKWEIGIPDPSHRFIWVILHVPFRRHEMVHYEPKFRAWVNDVGVFIPDGVILKWRKFSVLKHLG